MSRLEEVEARLLHTGQSDWSSADEAAEYRHLSLSLAAEVDELRGKLDDVRMGIGCARGQRSTQFCAEAAQRDEVITKLLAQFGEITCDPSCGITWTCTRCQAYARACEIAGRTE